MKMLASKGTGRLAVLVGAVGLLTVVCLMLFFVSLMQNIPSLAILGAVNDVLNAVTGFLSAALASALHPALRKLRSRWRAIVLILVWVGAVAITYGSWLILSGNADVERSSYFFFFGNGLIGLWLLTLNRLAHRQNFLPRRYTLLGTAASLLMMFGLPGLYGIILRLDGSSFSPLILSMGISFLGTGILYPIWCLFVGYGVLSRQLNSVLAAQ